MLLFTFVVGESAPQADNQNMEIDETLFVRIGENDMAAFDELYHLTERSMYAFSISLTRNHDEATDLMQDMYMKILSSAHLYKPMGKPLAWMFTITKNLFYSKYRKEKKIISLEPEVIANDGNFAYVTDLEDKVVLQGVLARLTEEEREIVLLYAVTGMKHREIADSLDLKLSTVLSKYRRALHKLKSFLEEKEVRS